MDNHLLLMIALSGFTLGILILGVIIMARGGKINKKLSNKLMIARVAFQFLTIMALLLLVYLAKG